MSRIITANRIRFGNERGLFSPREKNGAKITRSKILSMEKGKEKSIVQSFSGASEIGSLFASVSVIVLVLLFGAFYLWEVNDLATKGFEIRDLEKQIQELAKNNKRMQIREVELKSMYNIEKSSRDLNLVSPQNITYLEINGPVAMR